METIKVKAEGKSCDLAICPFFRESRSFFGVAFSVFSAIRSKTYVYARSSRNHLQSIEGKRERQEKKTFCRPKVLLIFGFLLKDAVLGRILHLQNKLEQLSRPLLRTFLGAG